jgi:hypothetical protein
MFFELLPELFLKYIFFFSIKALCFRYKICASPIAKTNIQMQAVTIHNPFSVLHYNFSWTVVKEQVLEIIQRFPNRYQMAYHEEEEQKIILFTSLDFTVFDKQRMTVIYISKIDSSADNSILAYEAKNQTGDITTKEDYDRGQYFIEALAEDMMLVY